MKSLRKRERKDDGLVGLGITSRRGSAGLDKLDTAMMGGFERVQTKLFGASRC
jgi:hypothetical protein